VPDNIVSIVERIEQLDQSSRERFERIFWVHRSFGTLDIPAPLAPKVTRWFARPDDRGSEDALERARHQCIIRTFNRWTFEGAVFNPLRALRPLPPDGAAQLADRIERARQGCDFCDPRHMTTADTWGRIEGTACITAANAAKFDAHHGLVIFREHNPLRFDAEAVSDFLTVAAEWFRRTHEKDPSAIYPFLSWNCLEKAAASQIHGHLQVLLSPDQHQAQAERLRAAARAYERSAFRVQGSKSAIRYFDDFIAAHEAIGLCRRVGDAAIVAHLVPIKEREVVLIAPGDSSEVARIIGRILRVFVDDLGVTCFNVGVVYPPLIPQVAWKGFSIVARIVDRGPAGSGTVDIGGMELYGTPVVAADPYDVSLRSVGAVSDRDTRKGRPVTRPRRR